MIGRILVAACLGAALLVSGPVAGDALAQEKKATAKSTPAKAALRECRAKGHGGKILTWKCRSEQPCCYNPTANIGVCGSTVIGCF